MSTSRRYLAAFILAGLIVTLPVSVGAAPIDVITGPKSDGPTVYEVVRSIISLLSWLTAAIAVIMIIIAGIRMTTSAGDAATVEGSRKQVLGAVIGLVLVISSTAIVNFVLGGLTTREDASQAVVAANGRVADTRSKVEVAKAALEEAQASGDEAAIDAAQAEYDALMDEYVSAVDDADTAANDATKAGVKTAPSTSTQTAPKPADHDTFRVATFNTRFDVSASATISDIRRIDDADIIGLQETPNDRHASAIKEKFVSCASCQFSAYMPRGSAAISEYIILWRKTMFKKLDEGSMVAAPGNWSWVKEMRINWVKLESRVTGRTVFLVDAHLPAHVEVSGRYRAGEADRIRAYGIYMDTITNFMQKHSGRNSAVFTVGDFNVDFRYDPQVREPNFPYARMKKIGARSNFQALGETVLGTHTNVSSDGCTENKRSRGARIIDYVFATNTPGLSFQRQHIVESTCSDHNAVSVLMRWNK